MPKLLETKYLPISGAGASTIALVKGVPNKKIRVLNYLVITDADTGVQFASATNVISGNILNNSIYGVQLLESCQNNRIIGNIIGNITNTGVYIDDTNDELCINNHIYQNYFLNNTLHARDDMDGGGVNYWYDTVNKIGNFWDNYTGVDANDNGIGDTAYIIPGDGARQDLYPIFDDGCDVDCTDGSTDDTPPDDPTLIIVIVVLAIIAGIAVPVLVLKLKQRNP